jgi:ABC-type sugar transport system ATPase subunit
MSILRVSDITKNVNSKFTLKNIRVELQPLQRMSLAGETGSGKSTLLKIIAGLVQPDSGEVWLDNERIKGPAETLVPGHTRVAYLSQFFDLPKSLRVEQVLTYANTLSRAQAQKLFTLCRIGHLLQRRTDELSGGEAQRVALARQLLTQPTLLLLDEPYSNLDIIHKNELKEVIDNVMNKYGMTGIMVSHDPVDALSWADTLLILRNGKIVQQGTPAQIYTRPKNEYCANLFGKHTLLTKQQAKSLGLVSTETVVFLRPENFKLTRKSVNSKRATILAVKYMGSHYEVEVALFNTTATIRTSLSTHKKNNVVFVTGN